MTQLKAALSGVTTPPARHPHTPAGGAQGPAPAVATHATRAASRGETESSRRRAATWADRAACRNYDPEAWFPVGSSPEESRAAEAVCRALCPVRTECLDWAEQVGARDGIWGGYNLAEQPDRDAAGITHTRRPAPQEDRCGPIAGTQRGIAKHGAGQLCRACEGLAQRLDARTERDARIRELAAKGHTEHGIRIALDVDRRTIARVLASAR